jgi:ribulose 1,5-bisphosphate carboxylase large subunit-like protein
MNETNVSAEEARAYFERIVAEVFVGGGPATRKRTIMKTLFEKWQSATDGHPDALQAKEIATAIGVGVEDFTAVERVCSEIRQDISAMRESLSEYYQKEATGHPVLFDLPKGKGKGYRLRVRRHDTEVGFRLEYFVRLRGDSSPDHFRKDLNAAFLSLGEITESITRQGKHPTGDADISSDFSSGGYHVKIAISAYTLDIRAGGLARFLTTLFGNQFRHESIERASLISIKPSSGIGRDLPGPAVGAAKLLKTAASLNRPLFSVPLPRGLNNIDEMTLASALIGAGVTVLTQSPFTTTPSGDLQRIADKLDLIAQQHSQKVIYFVNATSRLDILAAYLHEFEKLERAHVTMGLRVCPLSLGLNVCAWIRGSAKNPIPIYGYNLLPLGQYGIPSYEITPRAAATLLRLSGIDIINAGLKYQTFSADDTAVESFTTACRELLPDGTKTTLPMLTGGITPRHAYSIIRSYGTDIGLHIKKPILGRGYDASILKSTMEAYYQAIAIALSGRELVRAISEGSDETNAIRAYEGELRA